MAKTLEQKLQALVDKDEIRDVMYRYSRAVDRCDLALLKSCDWPDARDHHGFFVGNAHDFADYLIPLLACADGSLVDNKANCRCVDLLERRDDEWRLLFRSSVIDSMHDQAVMLNADFAAFTGAPVTPLAGQCCAADPAYLASTSRSSTAPISRWTISGRRSCPRGSRSRELLPCANDRASSHESDSRQIAHREFPFCLIRDAL